ncbi:MULTISPECIES: AtpZ/AtpI family protein [unclassified Flavobacterium]|uniref:AtpZ/AtpI family protein n=1 Tax=unclassified Flavobacterium TaxID=196869 RepID=UPI000EB5BDBA|nr:MULTISPECIES: AtpZ/AtpI family protein [unclassified Flavobacterium]RKS01116.1 putative F0F1-ATPase subunit (Ca2+/Mg2+ transporter) [Flavobacterium sp. 102]
MDNHPKKKARNKWLTLINIPIQMGVIVFLFAYLGRWLDEKYSNPHRIYVKILTMVGVAIAFYNINRQLKEINKSDNQ